MRHPLISLWRHGRQVHFLAQDASIDAELPPGCAGRPFAHGGEALDYLRFWLGDGAALADLRHLARVSAGLGARVGSDAGSALLEALAARLVDGSLRVAESDQVGAPRLALGRLCLPSGGAASVLAGLPALADLPTLVELPPLLPALEALQIEGAEVMPEVLQSLDQIDAALGSLGSVDAVLTPLPDRVPEVPQAMAQASADLRRELDAL